MPNVNSVHALHVPAVELLCPRVLVLLLLWSAPLQALPNVNAVHALPVLLVALLLCKCGSRTASAAAAVGMACEGAGDYGHTCGLRIARAGGDTLVCDAAGDFEGEFISRTASGGGGMYDYVCQWRWCCSHACCG
jgi:hypothetical protein